MPSWIDPVLLQLVFTLLPMKPPARAEFSTPNIDGRAALAGLGTVDGITLVEGDPILLTGQTDGTQNGVWLVSAGAWTKRADGTLLGSMTVILQGSSADTIWLLTNATEPVSGLDALTYLQVGGAGAGGVFTSIVVGTPGGFFPTVGAIRLAGGEALYSSDSGGDDISLIYADATTGEINLGDIISGAAIRLNTQVVFGSGTVQFDAGAGPVSFSQGQSASGAGHPWTDYGQQGASGSIGGNMTIGAGLGGTLHTNLPGLLRFDARGAVANVGPKIQVLTDIGNLEINQTTASEITIASPVSLTHAVTGTAGFKCSSDLSIKTSGGVEVCGVDCANNNVRLFGGNSGGAGAGTGVLTMAAASVPPTTATPAATGRVYIDPGTGNLMFIGTSGVPRIVALA